MNNYNYVYFYQIEKAQSIISIGSKIFIFDIQVKEFKDKNSIRLVLFSTLKNFALPEAITIMVSGNAFHLNEFFNIDRNRIKGMFGVIIDLPIDYEMLVSDIYIKSYTTNTITQKFSKGVRLRLDEERSNSKLSNQLRAIQPDFVIFPQIQNKYWQCKCGEINFKQHENCDNCEISFEKIERIVNLGIENFTFYTILNLNQFMCDFSFSFEANAKVYFNKYLGNPYSYDNFMVYLNNNKYKTEYENMKQKKLYELEQKHEKEKMVKFALYTLVPLLLLLFLLML
jgi:hypothetical protein